MIRGLGQADFRVMPWANGKGQTVEMLRIDGPEGLLFRLSRASVVEDGPFSLFPGLDRNLTVISGPGFDLAGDGIHLRCAPFAPVAFPGDVPVSAGGVTTPSDDFNVMWSRSLPPPVVRVMQGGTVAPDRGTQCAVYLPQENRLILTDEPMILTGSAPALEVAVAGVNLLA